MSYAVALKLLTWIGKKPAVRQSYEKATLSHCRISNEDILLTPFSADSLMRAERDEPLILYSDPENQGCFLSI